MNNRTVITGAGLLSAAGMDLESHLKLLEEGNEISNPEDLYLKGKIKPAKHLSDKRMMKVVSLNDAYGLVAVEEAKKSAQYEIGHYDTWRTGIYVGAPPANIWDNENYFDAISASEQTDGAISETDFGRFSMDARPTTLLLGLPNNVLCYAAIIMDAKGPNSNYTSGETSGHMSLISAAKRISYGKIDCAVAGGFSMHSEPVVEAMLAQNGITKSKVDSQEDGDLIADGSFFFMLEESAKARERGAPILAEFIGGELANDATGEFNKFQETPALVHAIDRCLSRSGVKRTDIGLIMTSHSGNKTADDAESRALNLAFSEDRPAACSIGHLTGNLMEAGGLQEIVLAPKLHSQGKLPKAVKVIEGFSDSIATDKPYTLITRCSILGSWSCILIKNPS